MNTVTSPRGPLPARVYWVRRGIVLLLALLLVFTIGKVLSRFGGSDSQTPTASTVAQQSQKTTPAQPQDPRPTGQVSVGPTASARGKPTKAAKLPASTPTGPCDAAKITVTPAVRTVDGGGTAMLPLVLTTSGGACTWGVSAKSLVVKITSGPDRIWSSQDCNASIADESVVVRPKGERRTTVEVTWNGRRSRAGCPKGTGWADPGYYHVVAATLGGNPTDVQFKVVKPPRPTVTKTAQPKKRSRASARKTPKG